MPLFLEVTTTVLAAAFVAVIAERLLRQYIRKLRDDCTRIEAARSALVDQQHLIDRVIKSESVPESVKAFVIDLSAIVPDREIAHSIADWINQGMPDGDDEPASETDAFFGSLRSLRKTDPDAFDLTIGTMRGAFVTMMLQWPSTARTMQRLAHRLAAESATEVVKSAAAVHRAASTHHWISTDHAVAA